MTLTHTACIFVALWSPSFWLGLEEGWGVKFYEETKI